MSKSIKIRLSIPEASPVTTGMGLQDLATQSGTSSKTPHGQASASQPASQQVAVSTNPSPTAVASQPFHQPEDAALAATTQQSQMPHQAPDVQVAFSCKAVDALACEEADSSSDASEHLQSDILSGGLPAAHLEQVSRHAVSHRCLSFESKTGI